MGCAELSRREYSDLNSVTQSSKALVNVRESQAEVSFDVLEEAEKRSSCLDSSAYMREKVSGVVGPGPDPGVAEGLAGVSSSEEIHLATEASSDFWERLNVRPNRRRIEPSLLHACSQYRGRIKLDLHVTDRASLAAKEAESESDSELEASVPRAEREDVEGAISFGTYIHTDVDYNRGAVFVKLVRTAR